MKIESPVVPESGKESDGSGCVVAFGVGLMLIGSYVLFLNARSESVSQEARSWTETACRILTAELERFSPTNSFENNTFAYRADFTYAYQVDGKNYVGKRDAVMERYSKHNVAQDRLRAFPVGTETVCYVNPNDPSDAFLDRSVSNWSLYGFWLFGFCVFCMGGGLVFATCRSLVDGN